MDPHIHAWEAWEGRPELNSDHDPSGKQLLTQIRNHKANLLKAGGNPVGDRALSLAEEGRKLAGLYLARAERYPFAALDVVEVHGFLARCEQVLGHLPEQ